MRQQAVLTPRSSRPVTAQRVMLYLSCFLTGIGWSAVSSASGGSVHGSSDESASDGATSSKRGSAAIASNRWARRIHSDSPASGGSVANRPGRKSKTSTSLP